MTQEEIHVLAVLSYPISRMQKNIPNYTKTHPLRDMVFLGAVYLASNLPMSHLEGHQQVLKMRVTPIHTLVT